VTFVKTFAIFQMIYQQMKRLMKTVLRRAGLDIVRITPPTLPRDLSESDVDTVLRVRPYTMTSEERILAAIRATEYVALNRIPGAIVECGVWRGGSMMAMAITLLKLQREDIPLYLFDTFAGMTEPTRVDGQAVHDKWMANQTDTHNNWVFASLADVQNNMYSTDYDRRLLHFVEGKVEDTIPATAPGEIALLRLDTDWYESTRHELEHLFPRLSRGGVLIVDDYGHFEGCRKAVDEYVQKNGLTILLNRIDYTGRIAVKL
jgi:hypothetical protein